MAWLAKVARAAEVEVAGLRHSLWQTVWEEVEAEDVAQVTKVAEVEEEEKEQPEVFFFDRFLVVLEGVAAAAEVNALADVAEVYEVADVVDVQLVSGYLSDSVASSQSLFGQCTHM